MQAPPPVPNLIERLTTMAANVGSLAAADGINWQWRPAPEEWSLAEVICHLRDVEREVHQARFCLMIAGENAFLAGVSADEWAEERGYCFESGPAAMEDFLAARHETVALLEPLDAAMWQRAGQHAFFGQTTMHELLYLVVRHDEIHWQQINNLRTNQE